MPLLQYCAVTANRQWLLPGLHILGVWSIAIAHPLLDLIGRSPEFLVAHRAGAADIIFLLVGLLLLPLPLLAMIALVGKASIRAGMVALGLVLALLLTALAAQMIKHFGVDTWTAMFPLAALLGLSGAVAYFLFAPFRSGLTVLGMALVVVPVVFVARPQIRQLMKPAAETFPDAADGSHPEFRPAPVVLVVFDELPLISLLDAGKNIDSILYPRIAALAQEAVWFRTATTVSDYTRWALPSILTGRVSPPDSIPTPADHPDTLFVLLRHTHRMQVMESVTDLCPRSICTRSAGNTFSRLSSISTDLAIALAYVLSTPDLQHGLPALSGDWAGFGAADSPPTAPKTRAPMEPWRERWHRKRKQTNLEMMSAFIGSIEAARGQPTFYFFHTLLSHHPYAFLPSGQRHSSAFQPPGAHPGRGIDDEWALAQNQQRQLLQTGFIDTVVGRLVDRLKAAGIYDDALIVLTSDHGVSFQPGEPLRDFTDGNAAEIMRVPLLVKFPAGMRLPELLAQRNAAGQRVVDRNVEVIDIAPTIVDVLGLPPMPRAHGVSLLDVERPERPVKRVVFKAGKSARSYGPAGPPVDDLLAKKTRLFNGPSNTYRIPRPPCCEELIGRRVRQVRVEVGRHVAQVRDVEQYAAYDPHGEVVPLGIAGRIRGRTRDSEPAHVAVAINGEIQAVTTTWRSRPDAFVATPPPAAWRPGHNDIEVFEIDGSASPPVLRRVFRLVERPPTLNLLSPSASTEWNVRLRGFYSVEQTDSGSFRWTRAHATVTVPVIGRAPRALRIRIIRTATRNSRISIAANGCRLFDGVVPRHDWQERFSLDRCEIPSSALRVALTSVSPRRGSRADRRMLGIAVREVILE